MLTRRDLLQKLRAAVSFGENLASLIVDSGQAPANVLVTLVTCTSYTTQPWKKELPSGYPQELKVLCYLGRRNPQGLALSTLATQHNSALKVCGTSRG